MQPVLDADFFEFGIGGGIKFGSFSAMGHIDLIDIMHQVQCCDFPDIFMQCASEIISDVVFSVGKCTGTAKSVHDGTVFAINTVLDFYTVNGTFSFFQRSAAFQHGNFEIGMKPDQFICGEYSSGSGSDDQHVKFIFHDISPHFDPLIIHGK